MSRLPRPRVTELDWRAASPGSEASLVLEQGGIPMSTGPVGVAGSFEEAVLQKMRREAERKRALQEAEEQDAAGGL